MTDQRAQVNVTLTGTPEQIRMGYRTLLDSLDDMTDIYSSDAPTWGCHMAFDLDEDWRKPHNRDKVQAFLTADLDGFMARG
jgi:hypothetical protein